MKKKKNNVWRSIDDDYHNKTIQRKKALKRNKHDQNSKKRWKHRSKT